PYERLFICVIHGALMQAMALKLPTELQCGLGHRRIGIEHARIDASIGLDATAPERHEKAWHPGAHAVFGPTPIWDVGDGSRTVRSRDDLAGHVIVKA